MCISSVWRLAWLRVGVERVDDRKTDVKDLF